MFSFKNIVNKILTEEVDVNQVTQALTNHNYVMINYEGDRESKIHKGKRIIQIYAYGLTKAGNPCIRAYQINGDTFRGEPLWKLFRLDRILSWKTLSQTFVEPPKEQGWRDKKNILPPEFNKDGDGSMPIVYQLASFDNVSPEDKAENAKNNLINGDNVNINLFNRNEKGQFGHGYNYLKRNMKTDNERPEDLLNNDKYWKENDNEANPTTGPIGKDKSGNDTNDMNDLENEENYDEDEDEWLNTNHNEKLYK